MITLVQLIDSKTVPELVELAGIKQLNEWNEILLKERAQWQVLLDRLTDDLASGTLTKDQHNIANKSYKKGVFHCTILELGQYKVEAAIKYWKEHK